MAVTKFNKNITKVYIQYNCIPHYRQPLFERLSGLKDPEFTIVSDNDTDTSHLKVVSSECTNIRQIKAKMYSFKLPRIPEFYWQPRAIETFIADRPDVMIALANPYSITAWALLLLGKIYSRPILLWGHGLLGNETGTKWWLRKAFYLMASGHLLYGNYAKRLLTEKGFSEGGLFVVYNSLNYEHQNRIFQNIAAADTRNYLDSLSIKRNERLIVFSGRLQPVKKLNLLVEALAVLAKKGVRTHLALIGDGIEKQNLQKLASQLGISDLIHFLGEHYDEEYLGLVYKSSDLCVIPSGAGLTIMHSMVFGTPVLVSNNTEKQGPEWEAVIDKKTGFYFKDEDIEDMAEKIHEITFLDTTKAQMTNNCRELIRKKYNPVKQVQIFRKAVNAFSP